jgi:hypothetical protein
MPASRPGDHITARCRRCDDVTGHIVTLVLNGAVSRVECRACGSIHKYYDAPATRAAGKKPPALRHARAGQSREEVRTAGSRRDATAVPAAVTPGQGRRSALKRENAWQEAMRRHEGEQARPYSMQDAFQPQSLLDHPLFGPGEILAITKPDKMNVLFRDGVKILRCKLS